MSFWKKFYILSTLFFSALSYAETDSVLLNLVPEEGLQDGVIADFVIVQSDSYEEGFEALKETLSRNKKLPPLSKIKAKNIKFLAFHPREDRAEVESVLNTNGFFSDSPDRKILSLGKEKHSFYFKNQSGIHRSIASDDDEYRFKKPDASRVTELNNELDSLKDVLDNLSPSEKMEIDQLGKEIWGKIEKRNHYRYIFTGIRTLAVAGGATFTMWSTSGYEHLTLSMMALGSGIMSGIVTWNGKKVFQYLTEKRVFAESKNAIQNLGIKVKNTFNRFLRKAKRGEKISLELPRDENGNVVRSSESEFFAKWTVLEGSVNVVNSLKDRALIETLFENEKIWDGTQYILPSSLGIVSQLEDIATLTPFTVATQGFSEKVIESVWIRPHEYYLAAASYYTLQLRNLDKNSSEYQKVFERRNAALYYANKKYILYNMGLIAGSVAWIMSSAISSPEWYVHYSPLLFLAGSAGVINEYYQPIQVIGKKGLKTSEMIVSGVKSLTKWACSLNFISAKKTGEKEGETP